MSQDLNAMITSSNASPVNTGSIIDDQGGIDGIYSQQFSVGIFFFLLICIVVFTVIVIKFMSSGSKAAVNGEGKRLKTGEKLMFFWIFLGIAGAVVMAAMQLLQGYLF